MFLQLYDKNHHKIAGLAVAKAATVESVLSTGDGTLSFLYPLKEAAQLVNEAYVRTKTDEYIIKEVQPDSSDLWCSVKATLNVEDLEGICWPRFESVEQTIDDCLKLAIAGTGWAIGSCTVTKRRTIRKTECSGWDIIQQARKTYRCIIWFDTIEKKIHISEKRGQDKGMYFTDTLNLRKLAIQSTSYDFCTRIKAEGKDGLTFKEINGGKDYVENHQYSNKVLTKYWKDERYTNAQSLLEDTKAKLEELSKPVVAYSGDILDLAKASPKTYRILDFGLGDTVELVDSTTGTKEKQRIVKMVEYPDEPEKNTCEFANRTASFEEIQQEQNDVNSTVNNITSDDGKIASSALDLDAITLNVQNIYAQELNAIKARIGDLEVTTLKATTLIANTAKIEQLFAEKATIQELTAAVGRIAILETGMAEINTAIIKLATIEQLNAANANIEKLLADNATINQALILKADIKDLQAVEARITTAEIEVAKIGTLSTDVANIKTLVNGNLTSANIQAGGITSDSLTIRDGFITNAMIGSVAAGKITAGKINTMLVEIGSENGNLSIKDNTIQIKEGTTIRVQIGKDANGEYSMYVWDKSGSLMFDAIQGLHAPGIKTGIIRDDMVADNANIAGTKIDIQSLVTTINGGITKIDSSIVQMDSAGQTLKVAFSAVTNTVNNVSGIANAAKTASETNTTAINVQKGRIDTLIQNTTITKDGQTVQLKDAYQKTVQTVEGIQTTIGNQQSSIDAATGDITSIKSQQATFNQNLQGLENSYTSLHQTVQQKADGTTVTAVTNRVGTLESGLNGLKSTVSSLQSTVSSKADGSIVTSLNTKVTTLESNLNGFKSTVSDTYITKVEFNSLEFGVNNLLKDTVKYGTAWQAGACNKTIGQTDPYGGKKAVLVNGNTNINSYLLVGSGHIQTIGYHTLTVWLKGTKAGNVKISINNRNNNDTSEKSWKTCAVTTEWKQYSLTVNVTSIATMCHFVLGGWSSWTDLSLGVYMAFPTLVRENEQITALNDKFSSYSTTTAMNSAIEQSKTNILSTVSNSYATKAQLNTIDGKFANYATTAAMNSAIDQKSNQILSTVSSTYATKTDFNNLSVGGRNLLKDTVSYASWSLGNCNKTLGQTDPYGGNKAILISGNTQANSYILKNGQVLYKKGYHTLSVWLKGTKAGQVYVSFNNGGSRNMNAGKLCTLTTEWQQFEITENTTTLNTAYAFVLGGWSSWTDLSLGVYMAFPMLTEGNKAMPWTPAPEDVDASITAVDSKFANYSTTSQMNSAIDQKANQITQTVSQTYTTKTEFGNLQVGGANLYKDTYFKTTAHLGWYSSTGATGSFRVDANSKTMSGRAVQATYLTDGAQGPYYKDDIPTLQSGKTYTWQVLVFCSKAIAINIGVETAGGSKSINLAANTWTKVTHTFTASVTEARAFHLYPSTTMNSGNYLIFGDLKIEEGSKATTWSPAPEDIDKSITAVDSKFASYSTTTQMNSAIDQKANQITQTVSQTYTTKTEFNNSAVKQFNNFSRTGNLTGWAPAANASGLDGVKLQSNSTYNWVGAVTTSGNVQIYSDFYEVDANKSYKLGLTINKPAATGQIYFGITCYNASKQAVGVYTGTSTTLNTNFYYYNTSAVIGGWLNLEGYLMASNVDRAKLPTGKNVSVCAVMHPTTKYVRIRFLNYYNSGTSSTMYFAHPFITDAENNQGLTDTSITTVTNKAATLETSVNGITSRVTAVETKATTTANGLTNLTSRVSTAEQKLTATSLITTITTGINGGTKFTTTKFTMDNTGLTIKGGGIKIQNNAGANVLYGDTSGNLVFGGTLSQVSTSTSKTGIEIKNGQINMRAWQNGDIAAGSFIGYGGGGETGVNFAMVANGQFGVNDSSGYYMLKIRNSRIHELYGDWFDVKAKLHCFSNVLNKYNQEYGIFIGSDYIYQMRLYGNPNWYIHCDTNIGAYGISIWASDGRMKANIQPTQVSALDEIARFKHRAFQWKDGGHFEKIGYIAQELEQIDPDYVERIPQKDMNGNVLDYRLQINEHRIIPLLTKAMQELAAENKELRRQIQYILQRTGIGSVPAPVSRMAFAAEYVPQYPEGIRYYVPPEPEPIQPPRAV